MAIDSGRPPMWRRRDDAAHEVDEELRFHLESRVAELIAEGWSESEARRAVRERFGDLDAVRTECLRLSAERDRTVARSQWLADIGQDLRHGWRNLRKSPAFTMVAVLSLAVGIGANTAIFSLLHTVLLARLSVPDPTSLVAVHQHVQALNTSVPLIRPEQYLALQELSGVRWSASGSAPANLRGGTEAVYTGIQLVDGSFQPVVGVRPVLGRFISDEDDRAAAPVIVISETFWVRHLGGIADAIGRTVTVNEKPFTVIGVTPSSYRGLYAFGEFTAAIPLSAGRLAGLPDFRAENRPGLVVVGRLDRNVSASAVQEAVRDRLLACCVRDGSPTADAYQVIEISRGIAGKADVRAQFATLMYSLMAGVLVLLLVACANVGTLLVARAEGRRSELAVRYSLGAERARLVRQLLTESLQLAVVGALFGYLCARAGLAAIASQLPPSAGTLSEVMTLRPHPVILGFTVVVTIACSALFGILPAWRATRVDIVGHLKDGGQRSGGRRADGVDRFLITAQVALALLLVTTAGMLVQSLTNLRRVDGGFNATNLLLVVLDARGTGYERSGILHLQGPLLERIRGLPGIRAAAASSAAPVFGGNTWITPVTTPYIDPGADESHAFVNPVSAGFFSTSGIALRRGREFTPADRSGTTPVAIVSETFIRRFFPEGDGLGNVVYLGDAALRVVGVAADARFSDLREAERPVLYLPILQQPRVDRFVLSVRTVRQPNVSAGVIRGQIEAMAPGLSILRIASMDDAIRDALVRERLAALLATLFGAFALGLATLGIYGVVACSVASRTAEIGTRMALGARRSAVLWLVLRQSVLILAFGFLAGLPLSLLSARAIASQLYGVRAFDPLSLATALLALGAAGVLASLLPARHATRVDPLTALRSS